MAADGSPAFQGRGSGPRVKTLGYPQPSLRDCDLFDKRITAQRVERIDNCESASDDGINRLLARRCGADLDGELSTGSDASGLANTGGQTAHTRAGAPSLSLSDPGA